MELEGHRKILTSLSLGYGYDPKFLVSAADDYVILWNLVQARQQLERGTVNKIIHHFVMLPFVLVHFYLFVKFLIIQVFSDILGGFLGF